ncbi:Early nodulin-like protein 1 [Morella rubra]|uniref:Early nodulin-like protein 1 n=1 Tax=Morella rubra TaxID=262757 RepID=A0A6A1VGP0_9ROSI|nr:Early nodulin-like protein 1 [Morella rubra]
MASVRIVLPILTLLLLLCICSAAPTEFVVGGKANSWTSPPSPESLNQWAEKTRFKVGDLLLFDFDPSTDSVLQVTKEDYLSCSKSHPIKEYKDGKTKVELGRPGPFYFLSKADGNCEKGQKLTVIVLSVGHHRHSAPLAAPALAPSLLVSPEPTLSPLAPPPANGAFGVRGGFTGILVGIVSLMGMLLV